MRVKIIVVALALFGASAVAVAGYPIIVVDPGHGGPGGWKYGANGDGAGNKMQICI